MGKKIQSLGDYVLEGVTLGKGRIARVELAAHKDVKVKVALKVVDTAKLAEQALMSNEYTKEARVLTQLRHPNIVRLYEALRAKTYYTMVLEYIPGGSLRSYLKSFPDGRLPESIVRNYTRQIVSALHYLHERNVVHRNINMENVILDANHRNAKLIDFGLCDVITPEQAPANLCGSLDFVAPEMMSGNRYGFEVDVWSLGVIVFNSLVGEVPFFTMPGSLANKKNRAVIASRRLIAHHHAQMTHLSESCQSLISQMLENSPSQRITISSIEVHPWFTQDGKKPFQAYQSLRYDSGIRKNVLSVLSKEHGIDVQQVDAYLSEKKNNRVTTMYYLLLDERKREKGIYEHDHTVAPTLSSPTSSSNLHNSQMCTSQYNAAGEASKFACTFDCCNFERSVSVCVDSRSPSSPSQSSLVKPHWGSVRTSLQQNGKLLDDYLEKRATNGQIQTRKGLVKTQMSDSTGRSQLNQLFYDRPFKVTHASLWQITRNSPLLISPDIRRKLAAVQRASNGAEVKNNIRKPATTEPITFLEQNKKSVNNNNNNNNSSTTEISRPAEKSSGMRTSKTLYFDNTIRQISLKVHGSASCNFPVAPKAAMDEIDETVLGYLTTPGHCKTAPVDSVAKPKFPQPHRLVQHNHIGNATQRRANADSMIKTNDLALREFNGLHDTSKIVSNFV